MTMSTEMNTKIVEFDFAFRGAAKIEMIKIFRYSVPGLGLVDAKNLVEDAMCESAFVNCIRMSFAQYGQFIALIQDSNLVQLSYDSVLLSGVSIITNVPRKYDFAAQAA